MIILRVGTIKEAIKKIHKLPAELVITSITIITMAAKEWAEIKEEGIKRLNTAKMV
jgi:hypothetical protein